MYCTSPVIRNIDMYVAYREYTQSTHLPLVEMLKISAPKSSVSMREYVTILPKFPLTSSDTTDSRLVSYYTDTVIDHINSHKLWRERRQQRCNREWKGKVRA